jgi:predicted RNase H-like HicB family nuclease
MLKKVESPPDEQNGEAVREADWRSGRCKFRFRRIVHVVDESRLHQAQDQRQPHHLSAWIELPKFAADNGRESKVLSGTTSAARVAKSESETMMKTIMQPDPRDYEIRIWFSAEKGDECFVAQVVEWPSIMAHGNTREEAVRQIQLALEGALQAATEGATKPPAPAAVRAS